MRRREKREEDNETRHRMGTQQDGHNQPGINNNQQGHIASKMGMGKT